ncbi:enhancer of mRNA-decapping protein 4-like [Pararge aegeria]|nr:enhancer of mRNA-decapping protein 4-like [Pararge aegeria]
MHFCISETKLRKSKSTGDIRNDLKFVKCADDDDSWTGYDTLLDSLYKSHRNILDLKGNNHKLRGIVRQQQRILNKIKDDTKISYRNIIASVLEESEEFMKTMDETGDIFEDTDNSEVTSNKQARTLLAAIEPKHLKSEDMRGKKALKKTAKSFDERQDNINADKGPVIILKRPNKTLPPDVTVPSSKRDIEEKEFPQEWWKSSNRDDQSRDTMTPKLKSFFKELKISRDQSPKIILPLLQVESSLSSSQVGHLSLDFCQATPISGEKFDPYEEELKVPPSPPQPVDPEVSVIDHLMQSAVINKKISEGDFNGSFEEALSYCNLSLVMGACRAVDPAAVFNPCSLSQSVLLSLVQQLATDMVHETQLKCRYLEEALINLDVSDQVTRAHLPLVVGEVRKHLSKFVRAYPHHVANRRISLIIMAADNLIK